MPDDSQLSLWGAPAPEKKAEARIKLTEPKASAPKASADPVFSAFRIKDEPFPGILDLESLRSKMSGCELCRLGKTRTNIVFGEGDPNAKLMLVGEGPGATEDETGRPFVGAAGQLLDKILLAAGFEREDVFIGNVVKCRPPGNRLPEPDEASTCFPYLVTQVKLIRPKVIVCLGAAATQMLIDPKARITQVRGQWYEKAGIKIMPTFHPAALLRDPSKKVPVWEDFQKVRDECAPGQCP